MGRPPVSIKQVTVRHLGSLALGKMNKIRQNTGSYVDAVIDQMYTLNTDCFSLRFILSFF